MKKKFILMLLIMLFLSFFTVTEVFSLTFYVDTTIGKDNPNNWGQNPKKPWKTIAFAVQQTSIIENYKEVLIKIASGTYNEKIIINIRPVSLEGTGAENREDATIIKGGVQDAITIDGVHKVVIKKVEVENSNGGIIVKNKASVELTDCSVEDGTGNGLHVTGSSNAKLYGSISARGNDGNGILVEESSNIIFDGSGLSTVENKKDGVLISGVSSLSLKNGTLHTDTNIRGLVAVGNSRIRVNEGANVVSIYNMGNGIAILESSNAEIFGKLRTDDNGPAGIGVNIHSNSSLSIYEGAEVTIVNEDNVGILVSLSSSMRVEGTLDISYSGSGILVTESSSMRAEGGKIDIWRNSRGISVGSGSTIDLKGPDPKFLYNIYENSSSGIGIGGNSIGSFSGIKISDNNGSGLSIGNNSQVSAYAIEVINNRGHGVFADGGSVFLNDCHVADNGTGFLQPDVGYNVYLIFGARSSISDGPTILDIYCDETVLSRGDDRCPP